MSDITAAGASPPQTPQDREFELAKLRIQASSQYVGRMIWLITLISGAISVIVVVSVVAISLFSLIYGGVAKIPDVLTNWGGIILGFYFGQFVNLVKDFMSMVNGNPSIAPPAINSAPPTIPTQTGSVR